jgi:lysozyme
MSIIPKSKPQAKAQEITKLIPKDIAEKYAVVLVGVRGYYLDTMGAVGKNDRGIYDDAMFLVTPDTFASFNANTDPSAFKTGVSVLKKGVHLYRKGKHKINSPNGYAAFRPATKDEGLPVTRDGQGDSIGYAINIHKGSNTGTSSLGCQTIPPAQWEAFRAITYAAMDKAGQKIIPYILTS